MVSRRKTVTHFSLLTLIFVIDAVTEMLCYEIQHINLESWRGRNSKDILITTIYYEKFRNGFKMELDRLGGLFSDLISLLPIERNGGNVSVE